MAIIEISKISVLGSNPSVPALRVKACFRRAKARTRKKCAPSAAPSSMNFVHLHPSLRSGSR